MNKIIFFNHFHNGDIHASRGFVRQIINKIRQINPNTLFFYSHKNSSNLLLDIDGLNFDPSLINNISNEHIGYQIINNDIYINTWYAQQHHKFMNMYGITIDCLYAIFDDTCNKIFGFSLSDISTEISSFFPIIDYSKFDIHNAQAWLYSHPEKKIFVETGLALSGQAINFALTPIITNLAQKHLNITFILSNQENIKLPNNVICAAEIIKKQFGSDLNELSFLSNYCDVIIGRASGPFTFTLTQNNLFQRKTKFLCFSNLVPVHQNKFWMSNLLGNKINYMAEFIVSNDSNLNRVSSIIEYNL